jgi:FixJ family two-component response regulator
MVVACDEERDAVLAMVGEDGASVIFSLINSHCGKDILPKNFALKEGANFLNKPFSAHTLAQTVRNSLDRQV